jgi:hypothetical protein
LISFLLPFVAVKNENNFEDSLFDGHSALINTSATYLSLKHQEYVTKAQVYVRILQVVAVSSYLPGFLGSTKTSKYANIPYIIHIHLSPYVIFLSSFTGNFLEGSTVKRGS